MEQWSNGAMEQWSNGAKLMLLFLFCFNSPLLFAQSFIPPDYYQGEAPNQTMRFYPNQGQVIDNAGNVRPEIQYYTLGGTPKIYASNEYISMTMQKPSTTQGAPDDVYRLDILPYKAETVPEIFNVGESTDHVNFYYPHCSQGITNVHGYDRVIYENYFDGIDMHLTSNANGLKTFFVVHPGANPADIKLELQGQSALNILLNGNLRCYMNQDYFEIPQAIAYEVDGGGNMTGMTWTPSFYSINSDVVGFHTGSYNTGEYLVLEIAEVIVPTSPNAGSNLDWSTFYGGSGSAFEFGEDVESHNNEVYMSGFSGNSDFPVLSGQTSSYQGDFDAFIVKFDELTNRKWATLFGGSDGEFNNKIAITPNHIILAGSTTSPNFPLLQNSGTGYYDNAFDTSGTSEEIYLVKANPTTGIFEHVTLFGENGINELGDLEIDENNQNIYLVGIGDIPTSPSVGSSTGFGFIARFDFNLNYLWNTKIGNSNTANLLRIWAIDLTSTGDIFIGGEAKNGDITSTNITGTMNYSHFGNSADDAFIMKLSSTGTTLWASYYGGDGSDWVNDIKIDKNDKVFIGGRASSSSLQTTGTQLGAVSNGLGFILELSSNGVLNWATPSNTDEVEEIFIDDDNTIYFTGRIGPNSSLTPTFWHQSYYIQNYAGALDAFILVFEENNQQIKWFTNFGGQSADRARAVTVSDDRRMYIVGQSQSTGNDFPLEDPLPNDLNDPMHPNNFNWYDDTENGLFDVFISKFILVHTVSTTNLFQNNDYSFKITPTISNGSFTVELNSKQFDNFELQVYNNLGQVVSEVFLKNCKEIKYSLDLTNLSTGMYYVTITNGKNQSTKKVILH